MIGGGAFILLKSGAGRGETANQPEAGLAGFPQIVCIGLYAMAASVAKRAPAVQTLVVLRRIMSDVANSTKIEVFCYFLTVLARKLAQDPASECRRKFFQVFEQKSILRDTPYI